MKRTNKKNLPVLLVMSRKHEHILAEEIIHYVLKVHFRVQL